VLGEQAITAALANIVFVKLRLAVGAAALVLLAVLFVASQAFVSGPASERCAHRTAVARYQWHHLVWRWLPVPGQYCVWTDVNTGHLVARWAFASMPDELSTEGRPPPQVGVQVPIEPVTPLVNPPR
jgi:hypothetical protein